MEYRYSDYYDRCFYAPILFCVIGAFISSINVYGIVTACIEKTWNDSFGFYIAELVLFCFLIPQCIRPLRQGGWYLRKEKEKDKLQAQGYIEHIKSMKQEFYLSRDRLSLTDSPGSWKGSYQMVIDGDVYYLPSSGALLPGDYVIVQYLPKSRFVLSIRRAACDSVKNES